MQRSRGVNVVALSRVLGHFSPRVTLDVYSHLLAGDEAPALDLDGVLQGGNIGATRTTDSHRTRFETEAANARE